jgi:prepilin-type N-terminal cleavage/methylation domain-containing protein
VSLHYKIRSGAVGFTLIELMVVISIIGLISSIMLAALTSAKLKAQDIRLISDMVNLRNAAELYRQSNGDFYLNNCFAPQPLYLFKTLCQDSFLSNAVFGGRNIADDIIALSNSNASNEYNSVYNIIKTPSSAYAIFAKLPSNPTVDPYVCIDSSGVIRRVTLHYELLQDLGLVECP